MSCIRHLPETGKLSITKMDQESQGNLFSVILCGWRRVTDYKSNRRSCQIKNLKNIFTR